MKHLRQGWAAALAALAIASASAHAQAAPDGLRNPLGPDDAPYARAPEMPARTFWTPSALRNALMDEPMRFSSMPKGFAVLSIEARRPTDPERAAGMAYRIDVMLNGPFAQQSLTYRIYETVQAAEAATDDRTLADRAVTLTSETVDTPMAIALPGNRAAPCARARSAAYEDFIFMRCYSTFSDLPVIVSGSVGAPAGTLRDATGAIDMLALESEKAVPAALLMAGLTQLETLLKDDPDGQKAYMRDQYQSGTTKIGPRP